MKTREIKKIVVLDGNRGVDMEKYMYEVKKLIDVKNSITLGYNVSFNRETDTFMKKVLVVKRSYDKNSWNYVESTTYTEKIIHKRRSSKGIEREKILKDRYLKVIEVDSDKGSNELEWKEQVIRVGTGFRVRKDEKDPNKRRFDVGYADVKEYKRKEGREVVVDTSSMSITIIGKGANSRVKVMNAVSDIEKRRRVSKYTGSGIIRKSKQGKRKLKSTKSSSK